MMMNSTSMGFWARCRGPRCSGAIAATAILEERLKGRMCERVCVPLCITKFLYRHGVWCFFSTGGFGWQAGRQVFFCGLLACVKDSIGGNGIMDRGFRGSIVRKFSMAFGSRDGMGKERNDGGVVGTLS